MKTLKVIATSAALMLGATGFAFADADRGHGTQQSGMAKGMNGDQADMMQRMMPMMMNMHARMTGGGMGMMGNGGRPGMAMMDRDMMKMMMGPGMMGTPSPDDVRTAMQARLGEFDANGDGSLSLSEFETLHSAMIRETMVDRFQYLDADGDGAVSTAEMTAPAGRMKMPVNIDAMPMGDTDN